MASQDWFDKDFYAVLGVSKDVSEAELKKTYRKLARQYHPDSNPGNAAAEAKFKEISEANSVLSDPELRREYDQIRAMGSGARFTAGGQPGNFEDVFGGMFGQQQRGGFQGASFEDLLGGMFGGGQGFRQGPTPGRDITAATTLDFVTAIKGETIKLQAAGGNPITVKIPAGVADGQKIKLKGKGEPSPNGGPAGDLVLTVAVREHPVFQRDGLNLRVTVPVTFVEAALGATIEVPTLGGDPVKLKVAPGTPNGRILRVKGRGVTSAKGTGDLLAEVEIAVPSRLTDEAAELLRKFDESMPKENPRGDLLQKAKT
ncbi:molecular chaperone DnaJ [Microbacteriaceae bacterium SG_E_30_P1]|uniref:Molecular chaperone DnaJ n=1 Tax=Antiquaquibacter oligotrophicus TaxID=2880260 RepID=A0ABT6KR84_9MICO|nr:DnaJ C-terminal domain-containing protein [Antiquaquibacter oligotrophicus]MDH6182480.1 molecular chaperone DnaJ [Antiquaquibacter oligotrophicus]UDF14550.1 DnaJ domain-containing protein [Antiquaquibacter oligotrophicus]